MSNCLSKGKYLIQPYLLFQAQPRTRIMFLWLFFSLEGTWNFSEPKAMALGKDPVMAIAVVSENLWCSCGNKLFIISHDEEVIKVCFLTDVFFPTIPQEGPLCKSEVELFFSHRAENRRE